VSAQPFLDLGRLREQSDDPTHMFSIYIGFTGLNRLVPTVLPTGICRFPT
jgi:hypothetical protein